MDANCDPRSRPSRLTVLVIEDSEYLQFCICQVVKEFQDFDIVGMANTAFDGVQIAEEMKPDIITLDLNLPDMSGIEVLKQIRAASTSSSIIVLTSLLQDPVSKACLDLGAAYVFDKVLDIYKFRDALEELVRNHSGSAGSR